MSQTTPTQRRQPGNRRQLLGDQWWAKFIGGHRRRPQCQRYPTSTIVIPISEENMSDWKLSFRYRKGSDIDIWVHSDIQKIFITSAGFEPKTLVFSATVLIYEFLDVGYRIKVYSDIRYNVGLRSLPSDIGSSDIKLSPISLITDIGVSAHLWQSYIYSITKLSN